MLPTCPSFSTCVTPWISRQLHPEGEPCITFKYKCDFIGHLHAFFGRPWVFSRALGCGARSWPACTPRHEFGSWAGSVVRALGVQCREIWQATTGSFFPTSSSQPGPCKPQERHMYFFTSLLLFLKYHSSRQRLWATTVQQPRFKLFPLEQERTVLQRVGS